jgi:hypothetical protein
MEEGQVHRQLPLCGEVLQMGQKISLRVSKKHGTGRSFDDKVEALVKLNLLEQRYNVFWTY